jgi:predicted transcriptional regulator
MTNPILDELLRTSMELTGSAHAAREDAERLATDELVDVLRHRELLEALVDGPLDRRDLEARLDVSRATSHRFTRWLDERSLAERTDEGFRLTGKGEVYADEVARFERNLRAAGRLSPLLDAVCENHREFVVGPFVDATVTTATPEDPYRPVARFVGLLRESTTFRGFNAARAVPPAFADLHDRLFDGVETELVYLPDVLDSLLETYPDRLREAVEAGHLRLHTREALPYGLAIFDDRVGIAGYDEETGTMRVFVDSDSAVARGWADRVFETYRDHSEPIPEVPSTD